MSHLKDPFVLLNWKIRRWKVHHEQRDFDRDVALELHSGVILWFAPELSVGLVINCSLLSSPSPSLGTTGVCRAVELSEETNKVAFC